MTSIWTPSIPYRVKGMRPPILHHQMADDEVTSSSSPAMAASGGGEVISPPHSLGSSDIGEVDLEFWDLDINAQHARGFSRHGGGGPCSDTSGSMSGTNIFNPYSAKR